MPLKVKKEGGAWTPGRGNHFNKEGAPRRLSTGTPRALSSLARLTVLASFPVLGNCDLLAWPETEYGLDATLFHALSLPLLLTAAVLATLFALVVLSRRWGSRYGSYIDLDSPPHAGRAGIEDMDDAFWHITRAVLTLLRFGMPSDVPDTSSRNGMTRARKNLRGMGIPFDAMTPEQIKCASWLLIYAGTRSPVSGMAPRRHALGVIRRQIDTLRSHNVPYRDAVQPLVAGFTSVVMLSRICYSAALSGEGNIIRRTYTRLWVRCMLLSDSPPPDVAAWAPPVPRGLVYSWTANVNGVFVRDACVTHPSDDGRCNSLCSNA